MPEYKTINSFGNLSFKKRTFNVKTKPKWRMPLHRCTTSKGLKQRNPSSGVAAGAWRPLQPYSWRRGSTRSWHQNSSNTAINGSSPQDSREKASVRQGWSDWRDNLRRSHCEAMEEKKLRLQWRLQDDRGEKSPGHLMRKTAETEWDSQEATQGHGISDDTTKGPWVGSGAPDQGLVFAWQVSILLWSKGSLLVSCSSRLEWECLLRAIVHCKNTTCFLVLQGFHN